MLHPPQDPSEMRHALRGLGFTLKRFAELNGFKYRDVSDVVRGVRKGRYGVGRVIVMAMQRVIASSQHRA